jgi:hypothetical protein
MTLKLPTPDEVISTWFALEDEAESTPALIRKVCDQFANVISPGDVTSALQEAIQKARLDMF